MYNAVRLAIIRKVQTENSAILHHSIRKAYLELYF